MKLLLLFALAGPFPQDPVEAGDSGQAAVAEAGPFASVAKSLADEVEKGTYNGVVAMVEVNGERVVEEAFGFQDESAGTPMEVDTIFRIYSMTKPITGVAAMILLEEGKLGLDDPVSKYIPALADLTVGVDEEPLERPMTVRDLHRHTAGLTYGIFAQSEIDTLVREANVFDPSIDLEGMCERLSSIPLKTQPGSTFEYSLASDVLGRVIEVAGEMPLDEYFEQRIFAPLGMEDTGFHVDPDKRDRVAVVYSRAGGALAPAPGGSNLVQTKRPKMFSGGGGLYSTAEDYLTFCRMLINAGELDGKRILKPETVALMASDQLDGVGGSRMAMGGGTFGLSFAVVTGENPTGPAPGSYWWGGMAGTGFWIDPAEDVIAVFMIQNIMELNHVMSFQSDFYAALRQ